MNRLNIIWVSFSLLTFNANWHNKERCLPPFIFSFKRELLHVDHTLPWNQTLGFDQWFLIRLTHLLFKFTYEALVIGYRSHCCINIIQYVFEFVSSCLDLCCQENFFSFLLLAFQGYFIQQDLYRQQTEHLEINIGLYVAVKCQLSRRSVYLINFGSVLFWAQADLALWANDSHKRIFEAVLVAHTGISSVLTRHSIQGPDAVERHPWIRREERPSTIIWQMSAPDIHLISFLFQMFNLGREWEEDVD